MLSLRSKRSYAVVLMGQTATANSPRAASAIRGGGVSAWADRHFKWLMVAPAALLILAFSIYPLLFSLWVAFVNYDFQIPGHAFVGLQNFQQIIDDPLAWSSLGLTIALSVTVVAIEFLLGLALALAMVKTFRGRGIVMSILIIPLFISPVIVGQSWALVPAAAVRPGGLPAEPTARASGDDQLADRDALGLYRDRPRRRLAVDAVHVRHPARRAGGHSAASLRGGRARRRPRASDVSSMSRSRSWRR